MRDSVRDVVELALVSWREDMRRAAKAILEALEEADIELEEMEGNGDPMRRTEIETMIEVARPVWRALDNLKATSQSFELTAQMLPEAKREEVRKEDLGVAVRRLVGALETGEARAINYASQVLEMVLQGISMEKIEPGVKALREQPARRIPGEALEPPLSGPGADSMA
jgi:hypothetical protein